MPDPFNPYSQWLAIPRAEQPPHHYRLLGVKLFESDSDVIAKAADARIAKIRSCQAGEHADQANKLLRELTAARVCLLNPVQRLIYDQKLAAAAEAKVGKETLAKDTLAATPRTTTSKTATPKAAETKATASKAAASPKRAVPLPDTPADDFSDAGAGAGADEPTPTDFDPEDAFQESPARSPRKAPAESKLPLVPAFAIGGGLGLVACVGLWFFGVGQGPANHSTDPAGATNTASSQLNPDALNAPGTEQQPAATSATETAVANSASRSGNEGKPTVTAGSPEMTALGDSVTVVTSPPTPSAATAPRTPTPDETGPVTESSPRKTIGFAQPGASTPAAGAAPPDNSPAKADAEAETNQRLPVPSSADRKAALELVMEVYKDDYAKAKKPSEKLALAEKLLKQAEEEADAVQRFTLLGEARNLALNGGGPQLLAEVTHQLAATFNLDESKVLADSLEKMADKTQPKAVYAEVAEVALSHAEDAAADEQFEVATRLANLALNAAKKAGQHDTSRQVAVRAGVAESAKMHEAAQQAEAKLIENPSDPTAQQTVGKYLCFSRGMWEAGLPHLAKADDAALKQLALQELQNPSEATDQVKLADGWWDLAEASKGPAKLSYQHRAASWYQQAEANLSGLAKTRVEKRLQTLNDKAQPAAAGGSPAKKVARPPKRTAAIKQQYLADLEPLDLKIEGQSRWNEQIIVNGVPSPHGIYLPPRNFSEPGHAGFKIDGKFRRFEGMVSLRDTVQRTASELVFIIQGDGKELWRSGPLQTRAETQSFAVSVTGVNRLDLYVECRGSNGWSHACWCEPLLTNGR